MGLISQLKNHFNISDGEDLQWLSGNLDPSIMESDQPNDTNAMYRVTRLQTKPRHVDIHNHWLRQAQERRTACRLYAWGQFELYGCHWIGHHAASLYIPYYIQNQVARLSFFEQKKRKVNNLEDTSYPWKSRYFGSAETSSHSLLA